jgi:hypothetical protein
LKSPLGGTPADGLRFVAKQLHAVALGCAKRPDLGMRYWRGFSTSTAARSSFGSFARCAFD